MRGLRSFAALLLILVGLGAYLYFVESKRTPGEEDARDRVFAVKADAIDAITLRAESGERTTIRKTGTEWKIVEPKAAEPDPAEVSSLTSNLASLEIQRVLAENATNLADYGLDPARFEVSFTSAGQEHRLLLGAKTPPGSDLYARLDGQARVFLVPAHVESTFNQTTFDLRDKSIVRLESDAIDRLDVQVGQRRVALVKKDNEWALTEPVTAPAEFSTVSSLIGRLTSARMQSVAAEPGGHGLEKPAATVTLHAGGEQTTLRFGGPAGENAVYARRESSPEVFTIESSVLDELQKAPADYRQKDLFDARAFNATRVEVTRGGQTVAFERAKVTGPDGREEEKWRQVIPQAKEVDSAKVDAFISAATSTQAQTFAERGGAALGTPDLLVVIKYHGGAKEDRITFSRAGSTAYAVRAGASGAAVIDPASLDSLVKAFDDIQ